MKITTLLLVILAAASPAAADNPDPFAPQPLDLTPVDSPDFPMPEPGWGEPLPHSLSNAPAESAPAAPAPDPAEEQQRINSLFHAILHNDIGAVRQLLDEGVAPDAELPFPARENLLPLFRADFLFYYATVERGLTPLMVAGARGHVEIATLLLERGADPLAHTKRHRTTALWLAGYAGRVPIIQMLLGVTPGSPADLTVIEVDLTSQTARVLHDGVPGMDIPISSGRKGYATPTGEFVVTNKHRQWRSTLYDASMPFYLRLSSRDFGLHAGHLPGYPASHGCIRLPKDIAKQLFDEIPVGTRVVIRP